jgi:hypothetical protein
MKVGWVEKEIGLEIVDGAHNIPEGNPAYGGIP